MLASFVGALGAFITGSNTVSDLLFAEFQYATASQLGISHQIVVALQAVGGAMGNMVCIHNIVAASAISGSAAFLAKSWSIQQRQAQRAQGQEEWVNISR